MQLKRKRLGPTVDMREGRREKALVQAVKTEEGEKKEVAPLIRKEKKMVAPWKREQATLGSRSTPKRAKACFQEVLIFPKRAKPHY